MANEPNTTNTVQPKQERRFSVNITIFVPDMSREDADKMEDLVRDAADEFTKNINVTRGNPL